MKICIDIRCLSQGRRTGVEEYTLNLMRHIFERDTKNEYVLFFNSWKNPKISLAWIKKYKNVKLKKFSIPNKILNLLFWYWDWPKIDKMAGGADIVYFPNIFLGSVSRRAKTVVTVHDLSFERYPEFFSWKRRLWHYVANPKNICNRADKIIAVSDSTKADIVKLYKINRDKVEVIHSGVPEKFKVIDRNDENLLKVKEKYSLPYKFILYLGTIEPRKNILGAVRAFEALQKYAQKENSEEFLKYKLVIAGESGWMNRELFSRISRSEFKDKIQVIKFVEDGDKPYFYNLASLFAYPSFFEGFGFPPLEAMKCGVPVIAGNNSSMPEVVADAGILVDPDRPDEIKKAMHELASSRELRECLVKKGLENAKRFDWKKTAGKMIKIFNGIGRTKWYN